MRLNDDPFEYLTIQAAVDASMHRADVVGVAGRCAMTNTHGGLTQVIYVSKTVTVRGGYTATNWTTADPGANPATLDAKEQGRVLYITGVMVMMYDAETLTVLEELTGFAEPAHLAVNPITNKIYVANHRPNQGVCLENPEQVWDSGLLNLLRVFVPGGAPWGIATDPFSGVKEVRTME